MEKKRSIGITIFAIVGFIFSGILSFVTSLIYIHGSLKVIKQTMFPQTAFDYLTYSKHGVTIVGIFIVSIMMLVAGLGLMISSVYLFKLKDWSRKLFLYLNTILFFLSVALNPRLAKLTRESLTELFISSIYYLVFIYFFTRPKVKEQFK